MNRIHLVVILFLAAGCGGGPPAPRPFFLREVPLAPHLVGADVTEQSLRVPVYPAAEVDEARTRRHGDRIHLVFVSPTPPRVVAEFYERRLKTEATVSKGPAGEQCTVAAPDRQRDDGHIERTTVTIEPRFDGSVPAGSTIRIIGQRYLPRARR